MIFLIVPPLVILFGVLMKFWISETTGESVKIGIDRESLEIDAVVGVDTWGTVCMPKTWYWPLTFITVT